MSNTETLPECYGLRSLRRAVENGYAVTVYPHEAADILAEVDRLRPLSANADVAYNDGYDAARDEVLGLLADLSDLYMEETEHENDPAHRWRERAQAALARLGGEK